MHPKAGGARPFFTGVEYCLYAPSSRLASRAPRRPKMETYSWADPYSPNRLTTGWYTRAMMTTTVSPVKTTKLNQLNQVTNRDG